MSPVLGPTPRPDEAIGHQFVGPECWVPSLDSIVIGSQFGSGSMVSTEIIFVTCISFTCIN